MPDATKVAAAPTGQVFTGATTLAAPTSESTSLASGFNDLGYLYQDDNIVLSIPDAGDKTNIPAFQNGIIVRTFYGTPDDLPTLQFTALETNPYVIALAFKTTVTQTATNGTWKFDSSVIPTPVSTVLNAYDGANITRIYAPQSAVVAVDDIVFANTDVTRYQITLELQRNAAISANFQTWQTILHS